MIDDSAWATLPLGPSVFGKWPDHRDFVRLRHDHPAALGFDAWLQDALAHLAEAGERYGDLRVRFLFAATGVSLIGCLMPSRDRAGRAHPVSIFTPVPTASVMDDAGAVWIAGDPFLESAEQTLLAAQQTSFTVLCQQIELLVPLTAGDVERAAERLSASAASTNDDTGPRPGASTSPKAEATRDRAGTLNARRETYSFAVSSSLEAALRCRSAQAELAPAPPPSVFSAQSGTESGAAVLLCFGAARDDILRRLARPSRA